MISIFISHAWDDDERYQEFRRLLDSELGRDSWRNLSIPRSEAIALRGPDYLEAEELLDRLEDQLILVHAALSKPGVPDVEFRAVWDRDGNRREEETIGSLRRQLARLEAEVRDVIAHLPLDYQRPPEFDDRKNAAEQVRLHPELSLAIRRRLIKADIVFVLATPFCRLRRWVDFEISACPGNQAKVIAVIAGGSASPDLRTDCHSVVSWNTAAIRHAVGLD